MNLCDRSNCFTQGFLSISHYQHCATKTNNYFFFIPGNIPTVSGSLGPTITEMGIHFALIFFSVFRACFIFFAP